MDPTNASRQRGRQRRRRRRQVIQLSSSSSSSSSFSSVFLLFLLYITLFLVKTLDVLATTTIGGDVQQVEEQHGSIDVGVVLEEGTHHGVVNDDTEPQPVVSSREERETLF